VNNNEDNTNTARIQGFREIIPFPFSSCFKIFISLDSYPKIAD
jgi:hypothetical protein